jgi:putative glutamine amidotransferase
MSRKPIIGVTPNYFDPDRAGAPHPEGSYYLNEPYARALSAVGAIPVALPYLEPGPDVLHLLERLDGVLLTGGFDVDTTLFGEDLHPSVKRVHPDRLRFEIDLIERSVRRGTPLFGICLGLQTLNLVYGGTFHQHVPDVYGDLIDHKRPEEERGHPAHSVLLEEGSLVHRIMGSIEVEVNSLHHQAAGDPGDGLVVSGRATDGVVEVIERPGSPFCLAVQWHPEDLMDRAPHAALFEAFVEAALEAP